MVYAQGEHLQVYVCVFVCVAYWGLMMVDRHAGQFEIYHNLIIHPSTKSASPHLSNYFLISSFWLTLSSLSCTLTFVSLHTFISSIIISLLGLSGL